MSQVQDYFYFSESNNPFHNLALEEYFVREFEILDNNRLIFFYINSPCVVLGKNQNIFREINLKYRLENDICCARRISGGGTVVHDMGNLNISIIEPYSIKRVNNYESTVGYLVKILNELGIGCRMNERNAILLNNGNKISGSAQFSNSKKILTHFTLLYDSDIAFVEQVLSHNKFKVKSKASKSHPSTVQNIKEVYGKPFEEFVNDIIDKLDVELLRINKAHIKDMTEKYLPKYKSIEYVNDKASDGKLNLKNEQFIEIKDGRVSDITLSKVNKTDYLNKRLIIEEIGKDDKLWEMLF